MTLFGNGRDSSSEPSGVGGPFERGQSLALLVPDGGDVGVSQVEQLATAGGGVVPDRLGDVRHGVAAVGPGGEEADLGLTLGPDGAVEEADAGVAAARIGQDARARAVREVGRDAEPLRGGVDLVGGQAEGGAGLRGGVAVVDEHRGEPAAEVGVGLRPGGRSSRRGRRRAGFLRSSITPQGFEGTTAGST